MTAATVMSLGRALVLTISDSASMGKRDDLSGPEAKRTLEEAGFEVVAIEILPDERAEIESRLRRASEEGFRLVVTSGGTGLSPRDVTPEATLAVIDRHVPGIAELMRLESFKITPRAALSRAMAGIRQSTLIINLPGSVKGVRECLAAVRPILLFMVIAFLFPLVTLFVARLIRPQTGGKGKLMPYECGVDPDSDARQRYAIRYYVVAILFVIFDVETVFLFPWAIIYRQLRLFGLAEMLVFLGILIVGYVWIIKKGALDWA